MRLVTGVGSDGVIGFRHAGHNTAGALPGCSAIDTPPENAPCSADPDRKGRNDQIRSGPSPHFPDLLYKPDKSRGQVTFLTEFASNKIRFKAFFIWFDIPHFAVVARLDRAIR
jgi:hypothetical protein